MRNVKRVVLTASLLISGLAMSTAQTAYEAWVRQYPDVDTSDHSVEDMVVDSVGNVYVTGYGRLPGESDYGLLTKKINPYGLTVWEARYATHFRGYPGTTDTGPVIRTDGMGNVYVGGTGFGATTFEDFVTIKYNSRGEQQWVARYNGPGDTSDVLMGLVLGPSGEVVVFGWTQDEQRELMGAVVKYASNGVQEWSAVDTIFAPGAGAIDRLGNIYISAPFGRVKNLKYSSDGTLQWKRSFNVSGTAFPPSSLAVDETGSVYVAGWSENIQTGDDYTWSIKYNSAGVQQWSKDDPFDGGSVHIVLDSTLVYLSAGWSLKCLTRNGGTVWSVACYPDSIWNILALTMTKSRDIVVADVATPGGLIPTASYSRFGAKQWARRTVIPDPAYRYGQTVCAFDESGYAYLSFNNRYTDLPPFIAKIDSLGRHVWSEPTSIPGLSFPMASASDANGNLFVAGYTYNPETLTDWVTLKYDSAGMPVWAARYNGPSDLRDNPRAMAVDASGNVYVTGPMEVDSADFDYVTIKYSPSGERQWVARYGEPFPWRDIPRAMAVDSFGYVYVTGESYEVTERDFVTVKYTPLGLQQWAARFSASSGGSDIPVTIAVDAARNVYVTGTSDSTGTGQDLATVKYDQFGQFQWARRYNGPANRNDKPSSLHMDPSGNILVSGVSEGVATQQDIVTIKYTPQGLQQWAVRYDDSVHSFDIGTAMGIDPEGNVYVTGSSTGGGNAEDYLTIKYDTNGNTMWEVTYDGDAHGRDVPTLLAVDDEGSAYVTGQSYNPVGGNEIVTVKYSSDGSEIWRMRRSANPTSYQNTVGLGLDQGSGVYVTLVRSNTDAGSSWTAIKYGQTPIVGVSQEGPSRSRSFELDQNYPNPFNPSTTIEYTLPHSGFVTLKVYNTLGQELATLVSGEKVAGKASATWSASGFPSGVYFYRVTAGEYVETKKMLLMK